MAGLEGHCAPKPSTSRDAKTGMQRREIPEGARERILGHVVKHVVIIAVFKCTILFLWLRLSLFK